MDNTTNVTYKINRLSNSELQLGLKTGAKISVDSDSADVHFSTNKPLFVPADTSAYQSITGNDGMVANKAYVLLQKNAAVQTSLDTLKTWISSSNGRITISNKTDSTSGEITGTVIGLNNTYAKEYGVPSTSTNDGTGGVTKDASMVVQSVTLDENGFVSKVTFRKLSTADLENTGQQTFDNFKAWNIKVGSAVKQVTTGYKSDGTIDSASFFQVTTGDGILATLADGPTLNIALNLKSGGILDATDGLDLAKISSLASATNSTTAELRKFKFDDYGRIIEQAQYVKADLVNDFGYFAGGSTGVLVPSNETANQADETTASGKRFLGSDGKWTLLPQGQTKITTSTSSTEYNLVGTTTTSTGVQDTLYSSGNTDTGLTFNPSTKTLTATYLKGNGLQITNINPANIVSVNSSVLSDTVLPTWLNNDSLKSFGNALKDGTYPANSVLFKNSSNGFSVAAEGTHSADSGTENFVLAKTGLSTASASTSNIAPAWVNITTLVSGQISQAVTSALIFQGVLDRDGSDATKRDVAHSGAYVGWMYKVGTAGNYIFDTVKCEVGDTIYCIKNESEGTISAANAGDYWTVVQGNIANALTFDNTYSVSATQYDANTPYFLAVKQAGTGIIHDSDISYIGGILGVTAQYASQLKTKRKIWGQDFDGTADLTGDITGTGSITRADADGTYAIGTSAKPYTNIYATTFNGTSFTGTASKATNLVNSLVIENEGKDNKYTFNGDALTIDINHANFGILRGETATVLDTTAKTTGMNAIADLAVTVGTDGLLKIKPSYVKALTGLTSSIFAIDSSTTNNTLSYKTAAAADLAIFYVSTTHPNASSSNDLNLSGNLYAAGLYLPTDHDLTAISEAGILRAAQVRTGAKTADSYTTGCPILTSYDLKDTAGAYEFIKSGFMIKTQSQLGSASSNWTDQAVPTANAVRTLVDSTSVAKDVGVAHTMKLAFVSGSTTKASTKTLKVGTLVKDVTIIAAGSLSGTYTDPSVTVKVGSDIIVDSSETDLSQKCTFEYKIGQFTTADANVSILFSGASPLTDADLAKVTVLVDYIEPKSDGTSNFVS